MQTIIVQMSDKRWTMEAMHLASALARNIDGRVVLLRLVLANNPGLLGWEFGLVPATAKEQRQIEDYAAIAEDYGVEFSIKRMQYISLAGALAQAVELLNADVLFAHIAESGVAVLRRLRLWNLRRQLHRCRLLTLDEEQPLSVEGPLPTATSSLETSAI
jgi:hypothetical protein